MRGKGEVSSSSSSSSSPVLRVEKGDCPDEDERDDWSDDACEAERGRVTCLDRRLLPSSASASESCSRPRLPPKGQYRAKRSRILRVQETRRTLSARFASPVSEKRRGSRVPSAGVELCALLPPERDEPERREDEGAQGQPQPGWHNSVVGRGGARVRVAGVCSWVCHP